MPRTKEAFENMREVTRRKIEAAALPLFARKGLSVSVAEIAQAAGISKGLMYSHYPSKDALIGELVRQAVSVSAATIKHIAGSGEPAAARVKQITAMMHEMLTSNHPLGVTSFMFMAQVGMSGFQMRGAEYGGDMPNPLMSLARIVAEGQIEGSAADGDPVELAVIYWAAVQGLSGYAMSGMTMSFRPESLSRILLKESFL